MGNLRLALTNRGFLIKAQKTFCKCCALCKPERDFNNGKGGDPVSRKVLERGVGTAWEVAC